MTQLASSSADETISPVKLAHVVLRTPNYQALVQWWKDLLGARVQFESPFICFLTYDDEHHRLAIVNIPTLTAHDPAARGVDHFAFTYATLADLLASYERLKTRGVMPVWCINHGPTTSLYYRDPDGNQVELQVDNFATAAEAAAWFHSEAFRANPIGVEFDPEILVARFRAGTLVSELLEQGSTRVPPPART